MTLHARYVRCISAICCGTLIALPLQNGYVSSAASGPATAFANSLRALEDGENTAPRDHWDPKYVEAQLGNDPARTFAWVRDHTYWIPYHGILRGPIGVLMDRQGDSLDRALLLATMLKDEGQTVRLAHGTLPAVQADALMPGLLAARRAQASGDHRADVSSDQLATIAAKYQLDEAALRKTRQALTDDATRLQSSFKARVMDQVARLTAAIGVPADPGAASNQNRASATLQDLGEKAQGYLAPAPVPTGATPAPSTPPTA